MVDPLHIGYVVKRYPRFSETFIVNEILAHERAGIPVHIFAVRKVNEPYFQSILGEVRSPVTYISDSAPKADGFWMTMKSGAASLPGFWKALDRVQSADTADVQQAVQLAIHAREAGITHLHAHFATIATRIAQLAAHFAGITYSFTGHAKDIFHENVDPESLRDKLAKASAVITVSDFNLDWLHSHYGAEARSVTRIYNGLQLSDFPYEPPTDRPPKIIAVGRLVEKKGFDILFAACAILRARGVDFECNIIGEGPQGEQLRTMIDQLALGEHVRMLGALPRHQVVAAFREAAVSVMPCVIADDGDRDGLPTVLIEAMALGTPCVGTDVTGIPEIVRDNETGLCVRSRDPVALADALERLLGDRDLRIQLAERGRALIEAEFDVDRNAAKLRALFGSGLQTISEGLRAIG
jgi:colanic acid/amylovoran biosynthesis glycosyltransferase